MAFGDITTVFFENRATSMSYVSALTLVVYDIIVSFGQEVELVWRSQWSSPKMLYFLARYYAVVYLSITAWVNISEEPSDKLCHLYYYWLFLAGPSTYLFILDLILLLRVYALYNQNKFLFIFLSSCAVGSVATALWAFSVVCRHVVSSVTTMAVPWRGCRSMAPNTKYGIAAYVPSFLLSVLFLILTVTKFWRTYRAICGRTYDPRTVMTQMKHISPLLTAFVEDGCIFFALITFALMLRIATAFCMRGPIHAIFLPWSIVCYYYAGSHLLLNLRWYSVRYCRHGEPTWDDSISIVLTTIGPTRSPTQYNPSAPPGDMSDQAETKSVDRPPLYPV
ncbi:hypothetical protein ARMSODRAFT_957630 [Armillaria solidipes]|uniref:DUF6533 domain-containing protein n=1 Tax=Armillaria solidipes TaxID=1076256 RepID=A0A2H3BEG5_9AGAR|nr:hypothetical protein ARMSODRAFT_957630 [Armillaria solidipes]